MPWKETYVNEERFRFVAEYLSGNWTMTQLCVAFGISRKTGYKILHRYEQEGVNGLDDKSRAPRCQYKETPKKQQELILSLRKKKKHWGARKLLQYLKKQYPNIKLPAPSTVTDILHRNDMI